ncbi:MAG: hypothetical protein DRO36_05015 [Candidatus Hecatellales archaeon]|nr:MAG: hypothetical protein DRO36_05015 [Candidatus Hecatellales archaeon]
MVTVAKIKLLLPDNVLIALTDDQDAGTINETLIAEIINDGYAYIGSAAPQASEAAQDEFVKNYTLAYLHAYAGLDEKARNYQEMYTRLLETLSPDKPLSSGGIAVSSNDREFTDDELEEW